MKLFTFIPLLLILAACSSGTDEKHPRALTLYSPNGEPLSGGPLGKPTCEQALGGWFDRLSASHGGHITETVFVADAQTQFEKMDIDHKGYIVSEELDRYRAPYQMQTYTQNQNNASEGDTSKGRKHKSKSSSNATQSDPALSMSDPVMSADTNLDFKVTPQEFISQSHSVFAKLDSNHNGLLERPEVIAQCEPKKP